MKITYNKFKTYLSVALVAGVLFSCSEDKMDKINQDIDNPHNIDAKFILTDAITSTAFSNIGGDFNHYFSSYVENEVGIFNQLYNAETRVSEVYSSSTFNNIWGNTYSSLKNARIIIDKCSEEGTQPGNYTTKGMGEVLAAINAGLLADAFGDTPFSQAALPKLDNGKPQFMNPEIDKQKDIYTAIIAYLDAAIEDLPKGDTHVSGKAGAQDILFKGDANKWLKLAYGLKARYTMHTLNVAEDKTAALNTVLECCKNAAQSASEQAAFNVYDGVANLNPLYDFFNSREYTAASASLTQKLIARNDPRVHRTFVDALFADESLDAQGFYCKQLTGEEESFLSMMAPNGKPQQEQEYYNTSIFLMAATAPTMFMSFHEVKFLEAEALVRLNRLDEAKAALKSAVVAGLMNMEVSVASALDNASVPVKANSTSAVTAADAENYFDTEVAPLFTANPLKETMLQKYIAFWGANGESTECYNDVRRLKAEGNDIYSFENPGKFPLRAPYGSDEVSSNPNVENAYGNGQYVFTENVWWAGGTR